MRWTWLVQLALRRPGPVLFATAVSTALLGAGALRLELRTDGEALRPRDHPVVAQDARDRVRFRDPRTVLLLVQSRGETRVESREGFRFLRDVHGEIERLGVVRRNGSVSLAILPRVVRADGAIALTLALDEIPADAAGYAALVAELRARPLVDGLLLSPDGRRALFSLALREGVSVDRAVSTLRAFRERASTPEFELLLGGPRIAEATLGDRVLRDLAVLIPLMLVVVVGLLLATLRCPGGVLIPMLETLVVLIWTFGAMGFAGAPIALVTTILPVVLMAMCISDEIHLLERVLARRGALRERVELAVREVGRPIVLTSVTTALGFLSFTSASVPPLRDFGLFAAFGILAAMLLTFSFVPALIATLPERMFTRRGAGLGARSLSRYGRFAARRPGLCFALGVSALAVLLPALPALRVSDSWVGNFDPASDLVRAERAFDASFWGSYRFDVVLEGDPGAFRVPAGAALVERVREASLDGPHVGGVETFLDPLGEIASALGETQPVWALPVGKLWDVFTLAEMSGVRSGLERLLSAPGDVTRIRLYVRGADHVRARELERHLDGTLPPLLSGTDVGVHYSGDLAVAAAVVDSIVRNQLRSIGWAIATVGVLLLFASRRPRGLYALVPVLATTLAVFALMAALQIDLGIATSMFASLTVGVGVDFGIHFQDRFERERRAGREPADAIRAAIEQAGAALLWNAMTLSAGFCVLMASSLKPNHSLGLLLSIATVGCYAASLLLLPFLFTLGKPSGASRRAGASVAALVVLLVCPDARAEAPPCDGDPDPAATERMLRLEALARDTPRIVRMEITTHYAAGSHLDWVIGDNPTPKTLWAVVGGDPGQLRKLFVFSGPGRMAGTSLLIHDAADPAREDAMWFYLRSFGNFEKLGAGAERAVVPGTALTYQDARGFIDPAKYWFRFRDQPAANAGESILACPRTPALAEALGHGAILVGLGAENGLVQELDYLGLGGEKLKRYEVLERFRLGDRSLPARVRLVHHADGFENDLRYEHWPLREAPPDLYRPDPAGGVFLERLRALLGLHGLGQRIEPEIERADAVVRDYEAQLER